MEERTLDELSTMSTMHIMESENTFTPEDDYPDLDFKVFHTTTTTDSKATSHLDHSGPEDSNIDIHEPGPGSAGVIDIGVELNNPPGVEIGIESSSGIGSGNGGCVSFISLRLSKCLICFRNIIHSEPGPEFQQFQQTPLKLGSGSITSTTTTRKEDDQLSFQLDEEIPQNILCGFSKLFKISSTIYRNIDLASLTNPLFCSLCNTKISESFSILRQIEKLEKDLDHLRRDIRDDLLESYRSDPDGFQAFLQGGFQNDESQSVPSVSMSQSRNKDRIRKAYAQCWTKSTISIGACPTLSKGTKATKKSRRNKKTVKKESVQAQVKTKVEEIEDSEAAADPIYEPYPADYLHIVTGTGTDTGTGQDHKNLIIEVDAVPSDGGDPDGGYEPVDMDDDPWVNNDDEPGDIPDKSVDLDGDRSEPEPEIKIRTGGPFALQSFQCEYCKRDFNKEDYKTSSGKYIFICDLPNCKTVKPIASLGILRKHHIINCLKKPEYICKYCERRCFSAKNLRSHIVSRHSKVQAAELDNVKNNNTKLKSEVYPPDSKTPNVTPTTIASTRIRRKPERSQLYVDWTQQQQTDNDEDEADNSTKQTSRNSEAAAVATESESKLNRIGNPIHSFACDYCKREFNLEDYKTEDGDIRIHCDLPHCKTKKPFTSLSVLKKHHKINCLKKPEYICKFCERRCFSAKNLRSHIVSRHSKTGGGANKVSLSTKNKISRLLGRKRARSVSQSDTENETETYSDAETGTEADPDNPPNRIRKSRPKSNKLTDGVKIGAGIGNPIIFFQCEFCKREFKLEDYLNEAGDYHINCDLPNCKTTKPFTSLAVLKKHHSINCLSKPEFTCEHCNRRCFSSRTLRQHIASRHPKNKITGKVAPVRPNSFTCEYCSRLYSKDDYKTVVNGKAQLQIHCDLPNCKTTTPFTIFSAFKRHHRKNCLLRPRFPCDVCGNNLFSPKALEEHVISQHTKQYEFTCEICGYAGLNPTYLKRHMYYKHSDEKPHKCEFCAEPFKDKRMLLCHVRRHKNEMPFVCEICGKGFPVVERFNKHKFVHETEKKFACPICEKLFRSPHYVDTHIWNAHKKLRPKNKPSSRKATAAGRRSGPVAEPSTEPGTGPGPEPEPEPGTDTDTEAQIKLVPINEESLEFVEMMEYDVENDD